MSGSCRSIQPSRGGIAVRNGHLETGLFVLARLQESQRRS